MSLDNRYRASASRCPSTCLTGSMRSSITVAILQDPRGSGTPYGPIQYYKWMSDVKGERQGVITMIYDHDQRGLLTILTDIQHE